jgi:hypothetical protein
MQAAPMQIHPQTVHPATCRLPHLPLKPHPEGNVAVARGLRRRSGTTRAIPAPRPDQPTFQPIASMYNIVYIVGAIVIIVVILKVLGLF